MGDTFMTVSYPFVDLGSGGSFDGYVAAADKALGIADASFKIIPGHGALSSKAELKAWRDMVAAISARVKKQIAAGKTLEAIQKQKITAEWDEKWGQGFIKPDQAVEFAFKSATTKR